MLIVVMRYCFLDGCGRLVSGNVLIVDFAVCIAFQCQDECRVVTQVVFREREAERLVLLDRTACHAADQLHLRLVPEADVVHRLLIVVVVTVSVEQATVVLERMVRFLHLYRVYSCRNAEGELAIRCGFDRLSIGRHHLAVDAEHCVFHRNGTVLVKDISLDHNR